LQLRSNGRLQRLLDQSRLLVPLALVIGAVSSFLLWKTLQRDYWDYWQYPKLKAAEFYIYPQLRYTLFDVVLLLWCLDGLVASGLSLWSVVSSQGIAEWTYRTIRLYFLLLIALILDGSLMLYVRNRGF
jgi:hypothetical protein